jgi:molecular chaperone GrpE
MSEKEKKQNQQEVSNSSDELNEETLNEQADSSSDESSLEDELKKCQEELNEQKNEYLRAYADLENSKKRLEKEKTNAVAFANEAFARDLLTVLDTFENAIASIEKVDEQSEAIEKIKEGMSLTYEQLLSILKKHGVEEVACEGVFDPNLHQVVMQVDSSDHKEGEIVQVLQKGYKLKDRLLRAAMVSSCK